MIETVIYSYLSNNQNIKSIVDNRIYPMILPQKPQFPAITYQKISGPRINSKSGDSGLSYPRIQFNCWGKTYLEAKQVAMVVIDAMNKFTNGEATIQDEHDSYEPDTNLFYISVDFIIWYNE
ncbi:DUF3168 domain-containing protein [Thermoanaerobacterium thermosaccharolyticum]|uniref:tail completion protein gp17 n=1 Tax=Thermoanaerobacterium thermosaccharolyticum TaxID=1517 RepID=UPI003D2E29B4